VATKAGPFARRIAAQRLVERLPSPPASRCPRKALRSIALSSSTTNDARGKKRRHDVEQARFRLEIEHRLALSSSAVSTSTVRWLL